MITRIWIVFLLFIVAHAEPHWIIDPTENGTISGAVGIAPAMDNKIVQKRIALLNGKAALSANMSIELDTSAEKYEDTNGKVIFHSAGKQHSDAILIPKIKDSFLSPNGELYLWIIQE